MSGALGYTSPDVLFGPIGVRAGFLYGQLADNPQENGKNIADLTRIGGNVQGVDVWLDDYTQFAVSAFWGSLAQGPYVAAAYQQRDFGTNVKANGVSTNANLDYTVSGYEFTCAYTFANGLRLATGYETQKVELDDAGDDVTAATIPVLALWRVNPNFDVWAEARFDAGTDDDETDGHFDEVAVTSYAENFFALGLRYNF